MKRLSIAALGTKEERGGRASETHLDGGAEEHRLAHPKEDAKQNRREKTVPEIKTSRHQEHN